MSKKIRISLLTLLILAVIGLIIFYLLTHRIAVLEPAGLIGKKQRDLFIDASLLMLIVVIPAVFLCLIFAWKYRAGNKKAKYTPDWGHNSYAEAVWWGIPFFIIIIISIITWITSHELNPSKPIESDKKSITIQVVALQWKWLFLYPEQGIATVNFIQFPENTPIRFEITADAPMNSFWIPSLGGQIYAMPAMRSVIYLIADKPGRFNGYSANISGKGFAGMTFTAKASTDEEFRKWIASVQQSSTSLEFNGYLKLVEPSEYVPETFFVLKDVALFNRIMQQYEPPKQRKKDAGKTQ